MSKKRVLEQIKGIVERETRALGRFDDTRWRRCFEEFFSKRTLVHNQRTIEKIVLSREADGALAVVDIDTLWSDQDDRQHHWWGRVCKGYTNVNGEWKMTMQIGVLKYPG